MFPFLYRLASWLIWTGIFCQLFGVSQLQWCFYNITFEIDSKRRNWNPYLSFSLIIQSRAVVRGLITLTNKLSMTGATSRDSRHSLNSLVITSLVGAADQAALWNLTVGPGTNTLNERHKISLSLFLMWPAELWTQTKPSLLFITHQFAPLHWFIFY